MSLDNAPAVAPVEAGSQDSLMLSLAEAEKIFSSETPLDILEPEILDRLTNTYLARPAVYAAIRAIVQEKKICTIGVLESHIGMRLRAMREQHKAEKKANKLRLVSEAEAVEATVGDYLPGAPHPELAIPPGYALTSRSTLHTSFIHTGEEVIPKEDVIGHAPAYLTSQTIDIDSKRRGVRLTWKQRQAFTHRIVDLQTISNAQKLTNETADYGFPVCTATQTDMSEYLHAFYKANESNLPSITTSGHCGYQGEDGALGFLIGRRLITAKGEIMPIIDLDTAEQTDGVVFRAVDAEGEAVADAYKAKGTFDAWLAAFTDRIICYPIPMFIFYSSFVGPLLDILDVQNFIVDSGGISGSGKTASQQAAASPWGNPAEQQHSSAIIGWNNTKVFVERQQALRSNMPFILNDTKTIDASFLRDGALTQFLYVFSEGRSKGRGAAGAGAMQHTSTWRSVLISSGETKLVNLAGARGGVLNRVISIPGAPFGPKTNAKDQMVKEFKRALCANYGHAGPRFVSWVFKNRDKWPQWVEMHRAKEKEFAAAIPGETAGRLATPVAAVWLAATLAHQALGLPWDFSEIDPITGLWPQIASELDDLDGTERSIQLMAAWIHAHSDSFRKPSQDGEILRIPSTGWIGPHWDATSDFQVYVRADMIEGENSILASLGLTPIGQYIEQWKDAGYLIPPPGVRGLKHRPRIEGEKVPCYCFDRAKLWPEQ